METRFKSTLILTLIFNVFILNLAIAASESPQSFTFQGRLFNAAGTDPLDEPVTLNFQIYNPSANCLLYQESQAVNLTNQSGVFAVSVGSAVLAAKRTPVIDPGYTMARIFKNDPLVETRSTNVTYCPGGYTPTAGDYRLLRITVTPSSTGIPEVLSPDQIINSVPHALVAETLQGLAPSDFIQKDPIYVTDARVNTIFGSLVGGVVDASALHHHDGRYIQISSSSAQDFGSGGFNTSGKGSIGTSSNFTNTTMSVKADADTNVGLAIRASSVTQSADLFQVQNSAGTKMAGISASGGLTATTSVLTSTSGSQLIVQHDTSNKQTVDVNSTGTTSFTAAGSAPKFSFMGGNVGIGLANPIYPLSVLGPSTGALSIVGAFRDSSVNGNVLAIRTATGRVDLLASWEASSINTDLSFTPTAAAGGQTEAMRIQASTGNVGIGTTTPENKLHVAGGIQASGVRTVPTGNGVTLSSEATYDALQSWNARPLVLNGAGNNVIIGGTTPANAKLNVVTNGSGDRFIELVDTQTSGASYIFDNGYPAVGVFGIREGGSTRFAIKDGNVGIGTTAPTAMLTITDGVAPYAAATGEMLQLRRNTYNGAASAATAITIGNNSNAFRMAYGGTSDRISFIDGGNIEVLSLVNGGNVGIGTTNPTSPLKVNGRIAVGRQGIVSGSYNPSEVVGIWSIGEGYQVDTTANTFGNHYGLVYAHENSTRSITGWGHQILGVQNGTMTFALSTTTGNAHFNGNVGIGLTNPGYKLDVVGDINASGSVRSAGSALTSDIRLKENLTHVQDSLKRLSELKAYNYYWKDKKKFGDKKQLGLVAQEVEKVFPEAVMKGNDGFLAVSYSNLVAPLIESVKQLYSQSLALYVRVTASEKQIALHAQKMSASDLEIATLKEQLKAISRKPASSERENEKIKFLEAENASLKSYLCKKDPSASFCRKQHDLPR